MIDAIRTTRQAAGYAGRLAGIGLVALLLALTPIAPAAASEPDSPVTAPTQSEPTPVSGPAPTEPTPASDAPTETAPTAPAAEHTPNEPPVEEAEPEPGQPTETATPSSQTETPAAGITSNSTTKVQQTVDSTATTGDATVSGNDSAGSATSGPATANVTIVNVVGNGTGLGQSVSPQIWNIYNPTGQDFVQGDITIDPASLVPVAGSTSTALHGPVHTSSSLTDIQNDVTLTATSGDAAVTGNGQAGDAASGDAAAMATIINLVSSNIGARNAFLGVVNIFGDLRGDILVPRSFVDSLVASNAPGSPTVLPSGTGATQGTLHQNINIDNNVSLEAVSGNATVGDNGQAGGANSGDATTNLQVFNLTGQEVIARNSLLVFVNVMGRWTGMIVPAPAGSTSAVLGGGVGSSGQQGVTGAHDQTVNIRNDVKVSARSGDATVSGNGQAGGASSGDAFAGASILNLVHSSFSLDDWFGALFINVIGSWLGDFDIAADTPAVGAGQPGAETTTTDKAAAEAAIQGVRVYRFNDDMGFTPAPVPPVAAVAAATPTVDTGRVLGDTDEFSRSNIPAPLTGPDYGVVAIMAAAAVAIIVAAKAVSRRRGRA